MRKDAQSDIDLYLSALSKRVVSVKWEMSLAENKITDICRDSTAAFCLRYSYESGEKREVPDSENPSDSGNGFM